MLRVFINNKEAKISELMNYLSNGTILNGGGSRYRIKDVLGSGGFGITYLGLDMDTKLFVAIKEYFHNGCVYRDNNALYGYDEECEKTFKEGLKRYEEEVKCLVKLERMQGIVKTLNFFYENQTAYMVMEYVDGQTLEHFIKKEGGRVNWKRACKLVKPLIKSLIDIHQSMIIHKDIRPSNIIISSSEEMILIDFGSARSYAYSQQKHTINVENDYAPPELGEDKGEFGPWTDVYSICAIIYWMISGEKIGKYVIGKYKNIPKLRKYDKSIPLRVEKAIQKGLVTSTGERLQNMEQLYTYLFHTEKVKYKRIMLVVALSAVVLVKLNIKDINSTLDGFYYKEKYNEIEIVGTRNDMIEVFVPEKIDSMEVTKISGLGVNVTKLLLPNTIKEIGDHAFKNCAYLESIYIPESVIYISENAFDNCLSLKEIIVSNANRNFYVEKKILYDSTGSVIFDFN